MYMSGPKIINKKMNVAFFPLQPAKFSPPPSPPQKKVKKSLPWWVKNSIVLHNMRAERRKGGGQKAEKQSGEKPWAWRRPAGSEYRQKRWDPSTEPWVPPTVRGQGEEEEKQRSLRQSDQWGRRKIRVSYPGTEWGSGSGRRNGWREGLLTILLRNFAIKGAEM